MVNHGLAAGEACNWSFAFKILRQVIFVQKIHFFIVSRYDSLKHYVFLKICFFENLLFWNPGPYLYDHNFWMHLEQDRTYARTFRVQRKEIFNII